VDELLAAKRQAFNPEKRKKILAQAMVLLLRKHPPIFSGAISCSLA
jgi:hypothetical protein